jgi:hypothetical protein
MGMNMLTKKQLTWVQKHVARRAPRLLQGPTFGDIFVAMPDGFLCQECVIVHKIDVGSDDVDVWQVGSDGWIGPCVCSGCKLSIPVIVDGES